MQLSMFHSQAMIVETLCPLITVFGVLLGASRSSREQMGPWDVAPGPLPAQLSPEARNVATRRGRRIIQRIKFRLSGCIELNLCSSAWGPLAQMLHRNNPRQPITRSPLSKCSTKSPLEQRRKKQTRLQMMQPATDFFCYPTEILGALLPGGVLPNSLHMVFMYLRRGNGGTHLPMSGFLIRFLMLQFISAFLSTRCYGTSLGLPWRTDGVSFH
ncbi:hypothetical protein BJX63DRAFT_281978 [Aspergillus granulosus]|uniref:Uncharacterized protein n=1 Tax=Aspergillus granulosus TaxID=176169 RepID=A0ABR4HZ13_9EURO